MFEFIKKTKEPTDEVDQWAAPLAALTEQQDAIVGIRRERARLQAAAQAATATQERADSAFGTIINHPLTAARTPAAEVQAARAALLVAEQARNQALEALAAHEAANSDLEVRTLEIHQQIQAAQLARKAARYEASVARAVRAGLELESAESEQRRCFLDLSETCPDEARPIPCMFPAGVFSAADVNLGTDARKTIFRNGVLASVAVGYPEIIRDLLSESEATAIFAAIEKTSEQGVLHFPGRQINWILAGGAHSGGLSAGELTNYFRGRIRREHLGL
jgi:hypothetical protein